MPIEPLTHGENFKADMIKFSQEVAAWLNAAERNLIVQSNAGQSQLPEKIDLNGFVTKEQARAAGLEID